MIPQKIIIRMSLRKMIQKPDPSSYPNWLHV